MESDYKHSGAKERVLHVFLSYRRSDGRRFAAWLRGQLESYRPPPGTPREYDRIVVYLDTVYERAAPEFWKNNIKPALDRSGYLIVAVTRNSFRPPKQGGTDWILKELDYF